MTTRPLVSRWAAVGDGLAFGELVARHGGLMRRAAAVALVGAARRDPGLVDDAVQEACVRLTAALRSFRGDPSPAGPMAEFVESLWSSGTPAGGGSDPSGTAF